MLRISKSARIFLIGGILIIVYAGLMNYYSQQNREYNRISQEINAAKVTSARISPEKFAPQESKLENQLAQAQSELAAAKDSLRQSIESREAVDTIFSVAESNEVEVYRLTSTFLESSRLRIITYSALSIAISARGEVDNLLELILQLNGKFPTGVIESTTIDFSDNATTSSAEINLSIYTYPGD